MSACSARGGIGRCVQLDLDHDAVGPGVDGAPCVVDLEHAAAIQGQPKP